MYYTILCYILSNRGDYNLRPFLNTTVFSARAAGGAFLLVRSCDSGSTPWTPITYLGQACSTWLHRFSQSLLGQRALPRQQVGRWPSWTVVGPAEPAWLRRRQWSLVTMWAAPELGVLPGLLHTSPSHWFFKGVAGAWLFYLQLRSPQWVGSLRTGFLKMLSGCSQQEQGSEQQDTNSVSTKCQYMYMTLECKPERCQ